MNSDFKELLQILAKHKIEYLIAGGYAVIHYSQPRYTKDLDIWLKPSIENAKKLMRAFHEFGIPLIGVNEEDFSVEKTQFSIGVPPCQLDFLTTIPDLNFDKCWRDKVICPKEGFDIYYLGREDLIEAKNTAGRTQDIADVEELNRFTP